MDQPKPFVAGRRRASARSWRGFLLSLSCDGNTLAVGASTEDGGSNGIGGNQADESRTNAGAVYLY